MIKKVNITISIWLLALLIMALGCSGDKMEQKKYSHNNLNEVSDTVWEKLSKQKFYFGHQSVGFNIMDGIQDLMKDYSGFMLKVVETRDGNDITPGVFAHSRVGKNRDPKNKIDDFANVLAQGVGRTVNAAALKLCYVDITGKTEIEKLFNEYSNSIETIRNDYPNLNIIHVTVPLKVTKKTWKIWLKQLIGKNDIWEFSDNIKRNMYNEMMIKHYKGKDPILDVAKIESTNPDGSRQSFDVDGNTYYSLYPGYTTDGGHLNEIGRKKVAEQFALLLCNLD